MKTISGQEKPIFDYLSEWVKSQGLYYENLSSSDSLYNFVALLAPPSDKPIDFVYGASRCGVCRYCGMEISAVFGNYSRKLYLGARSN